MAMAKTYLVERPDVQPVGNSCLLENGAKNSGVCEGPK
jgi:hypothetical protein